MRAPLRLRGARPGPAPGAPAGFRVVLPRRRRRAGPGGRVPGGRGTGGCGRGGSARRAPLGALACVLLGPLTGRPVRGAALHARPTGPGRPVLQRVARRTVRLARRDLLEPQRQRQGARAVRRVLGQTRGEQRRQRVRHPGQLRLLVHHAVEHDLRTSLPEGGVGGAGVGEGGAQREDVRGRGHRGAAHLLGREESRRADGRPDVRQRAGAGRPGDAEVDDPRALGGQQDVGRLQIAVHHARVMDGEQPLGQRGTDGGDLRGGLRTVLVDLVVQRGPRYVLRREPGAVRVEIGGDQPGRTAAADPPGGRDLPREARAELLVLGKVRPDHLQGHPLPALVGAEIDHAHPARAEPAVQPERPDDTRVLAPEPHHRHVRPLPAVGRPPTANRLTWHSLRIDGSLCSEAAHASASGLSVAGAIPEGGWEPAAGRADFPVPELNIPPQKGD